MKKFFLSSLKASIFLSLMIAGFFSLNAYIQPLKGSAQEIQSDSEQFYGKTNRVYLNTQFQLQLHQTALIKSEGLEINFSNVSDSRCPVNVTCIRQGDVTVELEVLKNGRTINTLTLIGVQTNEDDLAIADFDGYTVKLLRVDPYPGTVKTNRPRYVATLIISKKTSA